MSDAEFLAVHALAGHAVKLAMTPAMRSLALPADVLALGSRNVARLPDGSRVLRFARGKTGVRVEIAVEGELARIVDEALAGPVVHRTFVHRRDGKPFTRDGIGAMFADAATRSTQTCRISDCAIFERRARQTSIARAGRCASYSTCLVTNRRGLQRFISSR